MKQVLVALALASVASCGRLDSNYLPPNQGSNYDGHYEGGARGNSAQQVPILRLENNNNGDGNYNYAYETGDGTAVQEQGHQKGDDAQIAEGSFSYTGNDGVQYAVRYVADENGFQAQGAHLPTPPPVPEEILRALQENEADEARGVFDDGKYREQAGESRGHHQNGAQPGYNY